MSSTQGDLTTTELPTPSNSASTETAKIQIDSPPSTSEITTTAVTEVPVGFVHIPPSQSSEEHPTPTAPTASSPSSSSDTRIGFTTNALLPAPPPPRPIIPPPITSISTPLTSPSSSTAWAAAATIWSILPTTLTIPPETFTIPPKTFTVSPTLTTTDPSPQSLVFSTQSHQTISPETPLPGATVLNHQWKPMKTIVGVTAAVALIVLAIVIYIVYRCYTRSFSRQRPNLRDFKAPVNERLLAVLPTAYNPLDTTPMRGANPPVLIIADRSFRRTSSPSIPPSYRS